MNMRLALVSIMSTGFLIALVIGCGNHNADTSRFTRARGVHALAGAPTFVDMYAGTKRVAQNLPFGGAGAYEPVSSVSTSFSLNENDSATALLTAAATIREGSPNTVVAAGIVGQTGAREPQVLTFADVPPATSGKSAVRLMNLSADSTPVDLTLKTDDRLTPVLGLTNVSYGNASGYVLMEPGSVSLGIHDTSKSEKLSTATLDRGVALRPDKAYTVLVIGERGKSSGQDAFDARIVADN